MFILKDFRIQSLLLSCLGLILVLSGGFVVIFLSHHVANDKLFPISWIVKVDLYVQNM